MNPEAKLCWKSALLVTLMIVGSCTKTPIKEGYRILSYNSTTGQWIVLRNGTFDGQYLTKRLTLLCEYYKWGNQEATTGSNACSLRVGRLLVPNFGLDGKSDGKSVLYIFEDTDRLSIIEGSGEERVTQGFRILKNEVVTH